jgi:PAS domain S-box-containing protein
MLNQRHCVKKFLLSLTSCFLLIISSLACTPQGQESTSSTGIEVISEPQTGFSNLPLAFEKYANLLSAKNSTGKIFQNILPRQASGNTTLVSKTTLSIVYPQTTLFPLPGLMMAINYQHITIIFLVIALGVLVVFLLRQIRFRDRSRESESHFRALLDAAPTAMLIFQDYRLKYVNNALERLTGYSKEQLLAMEIWQLIHPQSLNDLNTENWLIRKNGQGMRLEFQVKTHSGEVVWVDFSAQLIDFEGKPAFLATALDIDDKKQFEKQLIEAEERYSLIVLSTNEGISDYDIETNTLYLSPQWKEMLGYQENEIANTLEAWLNLVHEEDYNKALKMFKKIRNGEIPDLETEYRMVCKDGSYRWIQVKLSVVFDSQSKPVRVLGTHSDITQKKKNESILRESEYRYKSLFSQNSAVMLITNPETGAIEDANAAACEYYGYAKEELIQMTLDDLNQLTREEIELEKAAAAREGRKYLHLRHRLKSDAICDVEVYNSKIELHGRVLNHSIIYDITERKRMEIELKAAKEEAEDAAKAKSLFISSVSHEIRTPLNAIIGLADLMVTEGDLTPAMEENLRSIKFSSDHLLGIINDVLDFSKLEAGKVGIDKTHFNLPQLVKDSLKTVDFKAREKGLNMRVRINPNVPEAVVSDPSRIKQVLLNLLSNAVKFTHEGHIDVYAKVTEEAGKTCKVRIAVSDTGIGIPDEKQKNVFESFSQAEAHTFRKYGGTGLGLSISKKLTELLGGEMGVKSIEGIGSTFWFELPMEISEQNLSEQTDKLVETLKTLSGMKVLLVEDDQMNQFVMSKILKRWDVIVNTADNGKEAIKMLSAAHYDVVLMDVHMPEMDGYEATRMIRSGTSGALNPRVPIIALTADITNETRALVRESGMNDFLSKPCEQDVLFQKLMKYGVEQSEGNAVRADVSKSATERQIAKGHIRQALWDIFDDDTEATKSMIKHFMKQVPENILQAREYLDQNQEELACQSLHKVKPGFSYLGFPEVADQVEKLQVFIRNREDPAVLELRLTALEREIKRIINMLQEVLLEMELDESKNK